MPRSYSILGSGRIPSNLYATHSGFNAGAGVEALARNIVDSQQRRDQLKLQQEQEARLKEKQSAEMKQAEIEAEEAMFERETRRELLLEAAKAKPETSEQEEVRYKVEEPETPIFDYVTNPETGKKERVMLGKTKGQKFDIPLSPPQELEVPTREREVGGVGMPILDAVQRDWMEQENLRKMGEQARAAKPGEEGEDVAALLQAAGLDLSPEQMEGLEGREFGSAALQPFMQNILKPEAAQKVETRSLPNVGLVERGEDGTWRVAFEASGAGQKPLRDLSSKDARELANMRTMAERAADLGNLVSGAEYNLAKWTPESVKSFVAQYVKPEGKDFKPGFFERALTVEPQYFLFAAEMLKAMQGSRPSDRDMEWYIENLPKATDIPSVKRSKIKDMVGRLSAKYNNEVGALKAVRFDMGGFPIMNPDAILEDLESAVPDGLEDLPEGFVVNQ